MARRQFISRDTNLRARIDQALDPVAKLIPEGGLAFAIVDQSGTWGCLYHVTGEHGPRSFVVGGPLARALAWYTLTEVLQGEDYDAIRLQLAKEGFFNHS